jgi:hypothetical protein
MVQIKALLYLNGTDLSSGDTGCLETRGSNLCGATAYRHILSPSVSPGDYTFLHMVNQPSSSKVLTYLQFMITFPFNSILQNLRRPVETASLNNLK